MYLNLVAMVRNADYEEMAEVFQELLAGIVSFSASPKMAYSTSQTRDPSNTGLSFLISNGITGSKPKPKNPVYPYKESIYRVSQKSTLF